MIRKILLNVVVAGSASLLITGCAATGRQSALPQAHPLGAHYPSAGQMDNPREELAATASGPTGSLQLEQALAMALLRNPDLAAFSYEVRAAQARIIQARVLPNPELELELEEYDRGGEGLDSAETAVVLGQLFELGGKRRWRTRVAEAEGDLTGWDYETMRLDVFAETAQRFAAVIAAQKRVDLSRSAVALAEKTSHAVGERVTAGKEPPLQASKSDAELAMARMEAMEAENALGVARRKLAAMWGAERAEFKMAAGSLDHVLGTIPSLEMLRARLSQNPDLARWDVELRLRQAILSAERAARIPDLEASVGYLQYEEDGTDALAFGVALPLPLFDRNQGNIAAAGHDLSRAKAERAATELTLAAELAEMHAALTGSHQRVVTLRDKVVPAMEQASGAAHEGYRQGKFGFLDMLDAQRGLFEAKGALVDALSDYQAALIDIQRLTGTSIEVLMNEKQED